MRSQVFKSAWNLFVVEDGLGLLILLPSSQELGLEEYRVMLGFVAGICEPEGHWLSVEPVDSKSFPRGERRKEIAKWLLGFLLFVFSFPSTGGMWGTVAPGGLRIPAWCPKPGACPVCWAIAWPGPSRGGFLEIT